MIDSFLLIISGSCISRGQPIPDPFVDYSCINSTKQDKEWFIAFSFYFLCIFDWSIFTEIIQSLKGFHMIKVVHNQSYWVQHSYIGHTSRHRCGQQLSCKDVISCSFTFWVIVTQHLVSGSLVVISVLIQYPIEMRILPCKDVQR